jgi:molybdopterin converting factor small subunit
VKVKVKVLGVSGIPPQERRVEFEGETVAALRDRIGQDWNEITAMDGLLLAFVNGKATRGDWKDEPLKEGDRVLFALPVAGG